jgi:hypothetical protein
MPLLGEEGGSAGRSLRAVCDSDACRRLVAHGDGSEWVRLGGGDLFPKGWREQWVGGLAGKSLLIACPSDECHRRVEYRATKIRNDLRAVAEIVREVARSKGR